VGDCDYEGGETVSTHAKIDSTDVFAAATDKVYKTARTAPRHMRYVFRNFDPGETAYLRLHFAEIVYKRPGMRLQSVRINGVRKLRRFDIVGEAHRPNKVVVKTFSVVADRDGKITVDFDSIRGGTLVNAIEAVGSKFTSFDSYIGDRWVRLVWQPPSFASLRLKRTSSRHDDYEVTLPGACSSYVDDYLADGMDTRPFNNVTYLYKVWSVNNAGGVGKPIYFRLTPHPFIAARINIGGPAVGGYDADLGLRYWWPSPPYPQSAFPVSWTGPVDVSGVKGAAPVDVYHSARYGRTMAFRLQGLPVEADYLIRLHFTEDDPSCFGIGKRLIDIRVNNLFVTKSFDIFKEAGGPHKVVIKECRMHLGAGDLMIFLDASTQESAPARLDAVEVIAIPPPKRETRSGPAPPADADALIDP
jgi:hypothetical protein